MNARDNNDVLAAFISVNKQLVALGEKDRLRQELHERLKNSQHRTQLENHVRKIIQQNGGVDSVNLETLVEQLRGCLPSIQEASGPVIESIIEFTQAQANKET